MVEIGKGYYSSKMVILKLSEGTFVKGASSEHYGEQIGQKWAIEWLGYAKKHILWVGLSMETVKDKGVMHVYDYDIEKNELKEVREKRVSHQERDPYRLHRLGDKFYYTGMKGQFMSLSVSFQAAPSFLTVFSN